MSVLRLALAALILDRRPLLLPLLGLLLSLTGSAMAAVDEIRIGSAAALSGPAAMLGKRYHAGAKAWFKQLNAQGGIHGRRVVVDLRDDGYEPERTEAHTEALLADARVLALFGYIGTPTSRVALPAARRAGIAYLGPFSGADMLWDAAANPTIFNVRASYRDETAALAKAIKASGTQRVSVLVQADLFGRAGLEAMRSAAQAEGLSLVATATVKRNSVDVADSVATLVEQSDAEAIFMASTYETCAAFIKAARRQGFKGRFYTVSFAGLEPLRAALGGSLRSVVISQVMPDAHDAQLPVVAAYQQAMRAAGDQQFDSISLEGYIAARVLSEGLRQAKAPLSRASVLRALQTLGTVDLGGIAVSYREQGRRGSSYVGLKGG
jgi:ABC-type branched-subunit amino acid transport system substrate-binding protein